MHSILSTRKKEKVGEKGKKTSILKIYSLYNMVLKCQSSLSLTNDNHISKFEENTATLDVLRVLQHILSVNHFYLMP